MMQLKICMECGNSGHVWDDELQRFVSCGHNEPDGDPIEEARMMRGEWGDRPTGCALLGRYFFRNLHTRGDPTNGPLPVPGQMLIVSYDLGAAHTSIHLQQLLIPSAERMIKLTFDELNFVGSYTTYERIVALLLDRIVWWEKLAGPFSRIRHISDDSAFNQFRAARGSFDARDIEELARAYIDRRKLPLRLGVKMEPAPKGQYSRAARVRMAVDDLQAGRTVISGTCVKTIAMIEHLEEDPSDPMAPRRDQRHIHVFDSWTYGYFLFHSGRMGVPLTLAKRALGVLTLH